MRFRLSILALAATAAVGMTRAPSHVGAPLMAPGDTVVPNDNRVAAGARRGSVVQVELVAQVARWRPGANVDSMVTVMALAEGNGAPRIPGPLVRVSEGTEVRLRIRNDVPDSTLLLHGVRTGDFSSDTLQIKSGATRELSFTASRPGTYMYWGTTTHSRLDDRPWRDSQLTGAIVVDPAGVAPDTAERIFVITVLDLFPSDSVRNKAKDDVFDRAINGRAWPWTERLQYAVGDSVRFRWVNGSYLPHPMHLHGFHFNVTAHGDGNTDTTYAAADQRTVVTEFMLAGSTFRMTWVPARAGAWLMHCHMRPHVTPFPERQDSVRHASHDLAQHPLAAMQGLVLGITAVDLGNAPARSSRAATPARRLRILAQERSGPGRHPVASYVLQRGTAPAGDSVEVPSSPLVLTRGETTAITVVNRLRRPTTVHWHGMELESVYDGVSGWSRTGGALAPLLAPADSFTVIMTPPRAGTFIYHTHMDEESELERGLYGAMLVLEPGQSMDPVRDRVFLLGNASIRDTLRVAINGHSEPAPLDFRVGTTYRLRFINIHTAGPADVALRRDSTLLSWRRVAKDGADRPPAHRNLAPSRLRAFGVGETWDVEWTPTEAMDAVLSVWIEGTTRQQVLRVR